MNTQMIKHPADPDLIDGGINCSFNDFSSDRKEETTPQIEDHVSISISASEPVIEHASRPYDKPHEKPINIYKSLSIKKSDLSITKESLKDFINQFSGHCVFIFFI